MKKDIEGTVRVALGGLGGVYYAIVDEDDAPRVLSRHWTAVKIRNGIYVRTSELDSITKKQRTIYLHRFLLNPPADCFVDHANRNPLDNRRSNLRLATRSQNGANSVGTAKSGFRGVYFDQSRIRAIIRVNGKSTYLGTYPDVISAALAYDAAARKLHGEFAVLNFPGFVMTPVQAPTTPTANSNVQAMTIGKVA